MPDGGFFYDRNCAAQPPFAFFSARLILFVCPPSQTRLQWFTRHRPKRKSWQLSARMRQEIDAASNFVSNLPADTSVSGGQRQLFRQVNNSTRYQGEGRGGRGGGVTEKVMTASSFPQTLARLMEDKFQKHWNVEQPLCGNGFRSIITCGGQFVDPLLTEVCLHLLASVRAKLVLFVYLFLFFFDRLPRWQASTSPKISFRGTWCCGLILSRFRIVLVTTAASAYSSRPRAKYSKPESKNLKLFDF